MQWVTPAHAVRAVPDGSVVVLPHGAVEPTTLYAALAHEHPRFGSLRLYSGLQFGGYPFLDAGLGTSFSYTTWQAAPRLRALFRAGRIGFLPLRYSQICPTFAKDGPLPPDVVVIQVSPPRGREVSLGISVSIFPELVAAARLVIAEINPAMPWTREAALLSIDHIDLAVESAAPLGTYAPRQRTPLDERIADAVLDLVPARAWVQLGVGAIPDAVLPKLAGIDGINLHSGMLTDGLVAFMTAARHGPRAITGEVAGGPELYRFVAESPLVELHPTRITHGIFVAGRLPRFVAINSAIEVDLSGQINGEAVDGVPISGVGGSLDFVEAAAYSPGGLSVVAMPSTTADGSRSRIVARLAPGTPATIPRAAADVVVTEFGAAHLRGRDLAARADALAAIAHPDFRDDLLAGVRGKGIE
jgi:acyl-CoA hydrolase